MNATEYLKGWTATFLKHRDLVSRRIVSIKESAGELFVQTKEGDEQYIIDPSLERFSETIDMAAQAQDKRFIIVCLNNPSNVDILLRQWNQASALKLLSIYFVNPFSEPDNKWIIRPHTHARVSDPESLELGVRSLAEGVHTITKAQLEQRTSR